MAIARALLVDMAMNTAKIRSDISKVKSDFEGFGRSMKSVAGIAATAFSVAQVAQYAKAQINLADNLNKTAQKVGVSVESLSAYQYAASLAGSSTEDITKALAKLSVNMREALISPAGEGAQAFRELGVVVKDASGQLRSTDSVFEELAKKFSEMGDGANKTALAMKLFGKGGVELIPLLNNLKELREEAAKAGVIISSDFAKQSEQFNDSLTRMSQSVGVLTRKILSEALPVFNDWIERFNVMVGAQANLSTQLKRDDILGELTKLDEKLRAGPPALFARGQLGQDYMERLRERKAELEEQLAQNNQIFMKDEALRKKMEAARNAPRQTGADLKSQDQLLSSAQGIQASLMTETEAIKSAYAERLGLLLTAREQELISQATFNETRERLELEHRAKLGDIIARSELEAMNITQMSANQQIQSVLAKGIAMTNGVANSSKKMFQINKALSLANAALSLPEAIAGAYAWGAKIGGPPLGAAMGALAGAAQLAQIAQIKNASFGSASSPAGVAGGGATPTFDAGAGAVPGPQVTSNLPTQSITVNVQNGTGDAAYWTDLIDNVIVPGLGDATKRNVNLTIR